MDTPSLGRAVSPWYESLVTPDVPLPYAVPVVGTHRCGAVGRAPAGRIARRGRSEMERAFDV